MRWVIGDVHGMYNTLVSLLSKIEEKDPEASYTFVGDFPDRGPFSKQVVDLVINLLKEGHSAVRGNHDDIFDWICNGKCKGKLSEMICGDICPQSMISWWMRNGLGPALKSYGFDTMRFCYTQLTADWDAVLEEIRSCIPEEHRNFYSELPMSWENDTHFVVHAYLKPDLVLTRFGVSSVMGKQDYVMEGLWSRFSKQLILSDKPVKSSWGKIGIFGHTPTFVMYDTLDPIKRGDVILIDTGAVLGGKLTAYCLEKDEFISIDVHPEDKIS